MTDSVTPLIMLAIFLAATLWMGLWHKKGSRTITEFTIGNKMFTTAALIATIVATTYGGGGLVRTVEMTYDKGLWYIMLVIGGATVYTLLCTVVASRIGAFMEDHISSNNHLPMADSMGRIYGKTPRIITACANVAAIAISVAAQITVTSKALQICLSSVTPPHYIDSDFCIHRDSLFHIWRYPLGYHN